MTIETWSHWPPIVAGPVLCLLLWFVSLALGSRLLRVFRISLASLSIWERGQISVSLGVGFLQYLPYLLGAAGKLTPSNLGLCVALLIVALGFDLWRVSVAMWRAIGNYSLRRPSLAAVAWCGLFVVFMALLLARSLTIGAFGADDDGYHLSAPERWLSAGTLRYLPTYTNTNAALGFEMLYMFGLAAGDAGVKLIHYCAGLSALFTLWLAARRLGSGWAGMLAISLLLVATPLCNVPFLFGVAYVDFGACWMTLVGVLLWLAWRQHREPQLLACMAIFVGLAASFKTTALTVALAWAPVLVWDARQRGVRWHEMIRPAAGLGLIAFLPICPWMFRSWQVTGNPVFPMLSSIIPTRDWNAEIASVFSRFLHYYSWGLGSGAALSEGKRKLIVAGTAGLVLTVGAFAVRRLKEPALRYLALFATLFVIILVGMAGMVFRYWLPAQMCAVLVATCWLAERPLPTQLRAWLPSVVLTCALLVELRSPANARPLGPDVRVATGIHSYQREYADEPVWNMWRFIGANTPADAQILVGAFYTTFGAANAGCFWLNRTCYTTDSHIQSYIRLNDWQSFATSLQDAKIQYLLISEKQFCANRHGFSFEAMRNEYPFCRKLAGEFGEKLAQFGVFQFYRIDPTRALAATHVR